MEIFYELVQVALGLRAELSRTPSNEEWDKIYRVAKQQAVVGVLLDGLNRLAEQGLKPPLGILLEWIGISEQIKQQNLVVNKRCGEITHLFEDAGYKTCILKGQGNARMYPNPLARQSGDIDIWVYSKTNTKTKNDVSLRDEITKFVKERTPDVFEQSHHIDFPIYDDVPVEVHYTPNVLSNPKYNKRFQKWCHFESLKDQEFKSSSKLGFNVPSVEFNAVYQMAHMFTHFFTEGIGLRHFVDYYYVLTNTNLTNRTNAIKTLRWLGMEKFAKGVTWIEQYCLGLEDKYLLLEPSEKIGRVILREMEEGGNFGQYDSRFAMRYKGVFARGMADTGRLITLSRMFPTECFWKVIEKIANQRWKFK